MLQTVQNAAARLIKGAQRYDHITPVLRTSSQAAQRYDHITLDYGRPHWQRSDKTRKDQPEQYWSRGERQ